jgi:hypothetical protein
MQISRLGFNNALILKFCLSIHFYNTFKVFNLLSIILIPFIQNVSSHIRFIVFVFLVSNVVAPPLIAIEGVHWARDGS